MTPKIFAVGIGPGHADHLTPEALRVISQSDVIVGYAPYVHLISGHIHGKETIRTGMKREVDRCESAINEARRGKSVSVVSSGDAGVYGMAGLLIELTEHSADIEIVVVPGVTAATAAAAVLGAPLSNDFAVVSLSDLLTPWPMIEKRLAAAGAGDFVVCLYNPKSRSRTGHLERACEILSRHKPAETPCGFVRNAFRENQDKGICTLSELPEARIDMLTTVIVGNSETRRSGGRLLTVRGYRINQTKENTTGKKR